MKKNLTIIKKGIAAIAMLAAFLFAIGAIGAYAATNITLAQCLLIVSICAIVECITLKILD